MKIEFINYPFVFTDDGRRLHINELNGTPRVGSLIDEEMNIVSGNNDDGCVGGFI
jgi:hypothetical protein